jgi:hypothetical protein
MRLAGPASLHGAPARAGAVRMGWSPAHPIHRQARIHRQNMSLSARMGDTRDTDDPWDTREPHGTGKRPLS